LLTDGSGASFGMGMINLKAWEERKESVDDVVEILKEKLKISKMQVFSFSHRQQYQVMVMPVVLN